MTADFREISRLFVAKNIMEKRKFGKTDMEFSVLGFGGAKSVGAAKRAQRSKIF